MNYLELVNKAILESGHEMDLLTSSTFASPDGIMYTRFKEWVKDSLIDTQIERRDWEWKQKQGQRTIRPRLFVVNGSMATAPSPGDIFEGQDSGIQITVASTTLRSGTWSIGDAQAIISVSDISAGEVIFGEVFDEVDPDPLNVSAFKLQWFGDYDISDTFTDCREINKSSFFLQETDSATNLKLTYIEWPEFQDNGYGDNGNLGRPRYITETPNGNWDFYPRPDKQYLLTCTYSTESQTLTDYDDEVLGLGEDYQNMLVWRAVKYYAEYDSKPGLIEKSERRFKFYQQRAEADLLPTMGWKSNIYDRIR